MKYGSIVIILFLLSCSIENQTSYNYQKTIIHEVNEKEVKKGNKVIVLLGGTLIDGNGGEPVQNSCVVIRNEMIESAGKSEEIEIPEGAEVIGANGQTILPGLIDAHYHNEESLEMGEMFLMNGVTSVRDPGAWIEAYDSVRTSGKFLPRLFLTGPHINTFPPAYPSDSYIVQDAVEGKLAVDKLVGQGATAIKVYYGLPIGIIKEVCNTAHSYGLPVTAHLEITQCDGCDQRRSRRN